MLLWPCQWRADAGSEIGSFARHTRPDGVEDARRFGPAARIRNFAAHRAGQRGSFAAQRRHRLRFVAPASTESMDIGNLGNLRKQSQGEVLCNHAVRPQTVKQGNGKLAANFRRRRALARFGDRPVMYVETSQAHISYSWTIC